MTLIIILIELLELVLYTIFTRNEMGNIPFICPRNYPYSSQLIIIVCQVRTANLLVMPAVALFTIITVLNSCCVGKDTELHSDIVLSA
ncbi:hypothetical protein C1646_751518 [Rhizophagus diaphanus]|nr:hypothetical protein C1646_751518 [Rhizophagus diaphanus] [Rhizophagus sp. MUCL 43196]